MFKLVWLHAEFIECPVEVISEYSTHENAMQALQEFKDGNKALASNYDIISQERWMKFYEPKPWRIYK